MDEVLKKTAEDLGYAKGLLADLLLAMSAECETSSAELTFALARIRQALGEGGRLHAV